MMRKKMTTRNLPNTCLAADFAVSFLPFFLLLLSQKATTLESNLLAERVVYNKDI
jgi:hypothetical protein